MGEKKVLGELVHVKRKNFHYIVINIDRYDNQQNKTKKKAPDIKNVCQTVKKKKKKEMHP